MDDKGGAFFCPFFTVMSGNFRDRGAVIDASPFCFKHNGCCLSFHIGVIFKVG